MKANADVEAAEFAADLDVFFEKLFEKIDEGKLSFNQADRFFPEEVKQRTAID